MDPVEPRPPSLARCVAQFAAPLAVQAVGRCEVQQPNCGPFLLEQPRGRNCFGQYGAAGGDDDLGSFVLDERVAAGDDVVLQALLAQPPERVDERRLIDRACAQSEVKALSAFVARATEPGEA